MSFSSVGYTNCINGSSSAVLFYKMECIDHSLTNAETQVWSAKNTFPWKRNFGGSAPVSPSHHPLRCNLSFRHVFKVERECLGRENCVLLCIRNAVKRGITRGKQNLQTILQKLDRAAPNALDRSGHKKEFPNSFMCPEDRCSMHLAY